MIRKIVLLAICLLFVGLFTAGCSTTRIGGDLTSGNIEEFGDYMRGMFFDGSDVRSPIR